MKMLEVVMLDDTRMPIDMLGEHPMKWAKRVRGFVNVSRVVRIVASKHGSCELYLSGEEGRTLIAERAEDLASRCKACPN